MTKLTGLLILAGIFPLAAHLWSAFWHAKARASRTWAQTRGTVISSGVRSTWENGSYPWLTYAYSVRGEDYRSKRICFGGGMMGSAEKAALWVEPYPAGSAVTVYYDPERPESATLERVAKTRYYLVVGWSLGVLLAAFGLYDYFTK